MPQFDPVDPGTSPRGPADERQTVRVASSRGPHSPSVRRTEPQNVPVGTRGRCRVRHHEPHIAPPYPGGGSLIVPVNVTLSYALGRPDNPVIGLPDLEFSDAFESKMG
jgi:hypothetical protein